MTVPGQNGPNAMLVSGWKTTPAGRQLASGDMILSGQVSPDGTLFAFTNTGYTAYWAEKMKGQDFNRMDNLDTDLFHRVLWEGLKGADVPYPTLRHGRNLSTNRKALQGVTDPLGLRRPIRAGN